MHNENEVLLVEKQGGTVSLILHRPSVRNALNPELIAALTASLQEINNDPSVRLVILSGAGNNFCSGGDLNWVQQSINFDETQNAADALALAKLMRTLNELNKPTICITQGAIYGGGVGLVACCDIVIALSNSVFCFSEVKLGIAPAIISSYVLPTIGNKAARRWFLTAETFTANIAQQLGLVHEVVTNASDLSSCLDHFVNLIMQTAPNAIAATKKLLLANQDFNCNNIDQVNSSLFAKLRTSAEGQEGLKAFLEKRKPQWQN
jgi:methylglutaconyl-CoA hydratase